MSKLSNPFSTGSGGSTFEIKIQASFVFAMMTSGFTPGFADSKIKKIKLQGKRDGYSTDDAILFVENKAGIQRKLLAQIKHEISFTEKDETLAEVLSAAWSDFNNSAVFDKTKDKLALITGPLSKVDTATIRPLLDWARHSQSEQDFISRVQTKYYSSDAKREKLRILTSHLSSAKGAPVTDAELWEFCKIWNVYGYDLDSESSVTQSIILSHINSFKADKSESADGIWKRIVAFTAEANQNAGLIDPGSVPVELRTLFSHGSFSDDVTRLEEHGQLILKRINSEIGGYHLPRTDKQNELASKINDGKLLLISGVAGCGKSALALDFIKNLDKDVTTFFLRTEDLNHPHIDAALSSIGIKDRLSSIQGALALIPRKILVIESIEKLLELEHTEALLDLFKLIENDSTWKVLATCRSYSVSQLTAFCLAPEKIFPAIVDVSEFSDQELEVLGNELPALVPLLKNTQLRKLLKNPFFLSIAYRVAGSAKGPATLESMKEIIWNDVIARSSERKDGLPLRRIEAFVEISVRRARQMQLAVGVDGVDSEAVLKLEKDGLVTQFSGNTFAPSHDLLEDWAIERFIADKFKAHESDPEGFFKAIGSNLAFRRTFRHWFQSLMQNKEKETSTRTFVLSTFSSTTEDHWKDELITCILFSHSVEQYLRDLSSSLLKNDSDLLKRFSFILRTACKEPDYSLMKLLGVKVDVSSLFGSMFLRPVGPGWMAFIKTVRSLSTQIDSKFTPYITPVLKDWAATVSVGSSNISEMREVGLTAVNFLIPLKDSYRNEHIGDLIEVLLKTYPGVKSEIDKLLNDDLFLWDKRKRHNQYIEIFCEKLLSTFDGAFLCHANPQLVIKVAWETWKAEREESQHSLDIWKYFGLEEHHTKVSFSTASALKGPFWALLQSNPQSGIDFIIELANYAAENYSKSSLSDGEVFEITLDFGNGEISKQICSSRLWNAYTATSVTPGVVNCALMALEKWLIKKAERGESIETETLHILRKSRSVFTTAVIAGIAPGFWNKMGKGILPVLRCKELYSLDIARSIAAQTDGAIDWFGLELNDPTSDLHRQDRNEARSFKWRKSHLEDVVRNMLFGEAKEDIATILDNFYSALPTEKKQNESDRVWRIALGRMDLRKYEISQDKEKKQIVFTAPQPPADIKKMQDKSQKEHQLHNRFIVLNLWGNQKYKGELKEEKYFSDWRAAFQEARWAFDYIKNNPGYGFGPMMLGGVFYTTAYCVREHLPELTPEELNWIIETYLQLIDQTSEEWLSRDLDESGMDGFHAAAYCLPKLFVYPKISDEQRAAVKKALVTALIHPDFLIQIGVSLGIKDYIWSADSVFAEACLAGCVQSAKTHIDLIPYYHRARSKTEAKENFLKIQNSYQEIRDSILNGTIALSIKDFSFGSFSSWELRAAVAMIPDKDPTSNCIDLLHTFFGHILRMEKKEDDTKHEKVDHKFESMLENKLGKGLLENGLSGFQKLIGKYSEELKDVPKITSSLVKKITFADLSYFTGGPAWILWNHFASFIETQILSEAKRDWDYLKWSKIGDVARALLFSGAEWKKRDFEQTLIASGREHLLTFFKKAGSHPDVFESFLKLCYHFPTIFLPDALPTICAFVLADKERNLFRTVNGRYYLEQVVMRFIIANVRSLKGNTSLTKSLLSVLDALVNDGSSSAYFLRERVSIFL